MSDAVLEEVSCAIEQEAWGVDPAGTKVSLFHLRNQRGMHVSITDYGGIITSLSVPDSDGNIDDVVLGFDALEDYVADHPYFGAIVGRYANRIANGTFSIAGVEYQLDVNNESNHLHGGFEGFDSRVWTVVSIEQGERARLELSLVSPDGDQGFPGELTVTAVYTLTAENVLQLELLATSSAPTVCNLTQHSYFNLDGADGSSVLDHQVQIFSDAFLPVSDRLIPHGPPETVVDTAFDFRQGKAIGDGIHGDCEQLVLGGGYDHNWLVPGKIGTLRHAATAISPKSGRSLELWTTDPGIQFYTGNFLDGTLVGKGGHVYSKRSGFCLEPQLYPNSPNNADYPSSLLMPGSTYRHQMEYRFGTEDA